MPPNFPVRIHPYDVIELGNDKKVVDLSHLAYFRFTNCVCPCSLESTLIGIYKSF